MKTLNEILKQQPVFLHNWKGKMDLIGDFENVFLKESEYNAEVSPWPNVEYWNEEKSKMKPLIEKWTPTNILFASYGTDNYSGDAFVLFEQNGKIFEANGSHCSCYGLEGQWSPEETTLEALAHRLTTGSMGTDSYSDNEFAAELKTFIGLE
jgi:hypothetical protein